jgi:hypothetical protein
MNTNNENCIFCEAACNTHRRSALSYQEYMCNNCGEYCVSDSFKPNINQRMLSIMHYYIRHIFIANDKPLLFVKDIKGINDDGADYNYIDIEMLENLQPKTLNDRIDMVMLNLSIEIRFLGDSLSIPDSYKEVKYRNYFMVDDAYSPEQFWKQVKEMIAILLEYGLIKCSIVIPIKTDEYTFTALGWNHVSKLQAKNKVFPQAFVAMWFSPDTELARSQIVQAVKDCGYLPVIIDEKEHNNQIVPEILFEIQRSKFVVADLTGHRNGVYYEAGYSQALGKEVILTCKDDDFKSRHFDVAQINTIRWIDEDNLYNSLMKRIEATVGLNK